MERTGASGILQESILQEGILAEGLPPGIRPLGLHQARLAAAEAAARLDPAACGVVMAAVADVEDEAFRWGALVGALAVLEGSRSREDLRAVALRAAELLGGTAPGTVDLRASDQDDDAAGPMAGSAESPAGEWA